MNDLTSSDYKRRIQITNKNEAREELLSFTHKMLTIEGDQG